MKRKVRHIAGNVIIICLLGIMAVSGWNVYKAYKEYVANQKSYEDIKKNVVDFDALQKVNPDIIAWVKYEGTMIDYPILKCKTNDQYLYTRYDGKYDDHGSLFVECITRNPFKQFNTIVYGHRMRDGSMFNNLKFLGDPAYAKEYPKMDLYTPDGEYDLLVWAVLNSEVGDPIYYTNMPIPERKEYVENIKKSAAYLTDVQVDERSQLVVMSTCVYATGDDRLVVVCKMVPRDPTTEKVEVEVEMSTWERIKSFLKGLKP